MKKYLTPINIVLLLIFMTAFAVRVWGLDKYPVGFTQDEAALGYDAYSLLETGKDQWGESWPLVLRSFGDFKLPLYTYLSIPTVALFGLNEYSVRLPNALLGFLAVIATYLMAYELTKKKDLAILASLFLALSPWHISLSRGAFEANLTAFFMTAGIWTFLKGLKNNKWMLASPIFMGLNLFSYHSARLVTPLIYILLISVFSLKKLNAGLYIKFFRKYKLATFIFLVFFALAVGTMFFGGGKRGADILITNPTDKWQSVSDRRYMAVLQGLPDSYARIFSNKITYTLDLFYTNYLSYLSPDFLFSQGAGEWSYGMIPGRGVLYSFELITITAGLISLIKKRSVKGMDLVTLWILVAIIPAALTKGPGHAANRVAVMIPAIQIFSAYGALSLYSYLSEYFKPKYTKYFYFIFLSSIVVVSSVIFFEDYIYHQPVHAASAMQKANKEIVDKVLKIEADYEEIMVSRTLSVPQVWVSFNSKWNPRDLQQYSKDWLEYERQGFLYIDQFDGYRLGKYTFGSLDPLSYRGRSDVLIVGKPEEFPAGTDPILTSYSSDGTIAFQAVESKAIK